MRSLRRRLSYSLPRRCYTSCKQTINRLNAHNEQFVMNLSLLLLLAGCAFAFHQQGGLDWMSEADFKTVPYETSSRLPSTPSQLNSSLSNCSKKYTWADEVKASSSADNSRGNQKLFVIASTSKEKHVDVLDFLRKAAILSLITFIFIILLHLRRTLNEQICLASPQPVTWQLLLFRLLPLRTLSRVNGCLAGLKFPYIVRIILLSLFVKFFGVKLHEAEDESVSSYETLRSLFKRTLKSGLRPINMHSSLVSPVDGKVMHIGTLTDDYSAIEQVKGVQYSLKAFLGRGLLPRYGRSNGMVLHTTVLYLSPGDYHHFHSPADWRLHLYRHFPGELVTVTPWAVKCMPGLLALNERVLLSGQWEHGYFSLTAVGALNVGSIYIDNYKELQTNVKGHYKFNTYTDKHLGKVGDPLSRGEHIGGFNFGSTIVLIFEAPSTFQFNIKIGDAIKYGQSIGDV